MSAQELLAWGTGVFFLFLLLIIAFIIYIRERPVPPAAMLLFRIIIALAGAGFAAVLPGFLEIKGAAANFAIRAGGALAAFIVLYFFNPPDRVEQQVAAVRKAQPRQVPRDSIETDLPEQDSRP